LAVAAVAARSTVAAVAAIAALAAPDGDGVAVGLAAGSADAALATEAAFAAVAAGANLVRSQEGTIGAMASVILAMRPVAEEEGGGGHHYRLAQSGHKSVIASRQSEQICSLQPSHQMTSLAGLSSWHQ
jgi:hypothetical protein